MEHAQIEIRDQQKASWNKFSAGWKVWDDLTMEFLKPMGDEIIRRIHPAKGDKVLDLASGTGEPGLTIATMLDTGKVVITDLADDMLVIAREKAKASGLKNVETVACDVCELPFEDNSFDAVSCRFGFMFFPDLLLAAREITRVLKPGGRIATAVWNGPEKNFWVTAMMDTIRKYLPLPAPPPGAPGIFRCAGEGFMTNHFSKAGLSQVSEIEILGKLDCGTSDIYWSYMTDVVAPVVSALTNVDEKTKGMIRGEVCRKINEKYPEGQVSIDGSAQVISAVK